MSLIQEYTYSKRLETNVENLLEIKKDLTHQVSLAHENKSYIWMNAHRVGLLAEDEYLIRVPEGLFSVSMSYSPGSVIKNRKPFMVSVKLLFFIAFSIQCIMYSFRVFFRKKE